MSTVLVVDDEKNVRDTLAATFELEGFRVLTAPDGATALRIVDRAGIDLLFIDLQMPELDGIETLRRLREAGHDLPVVFLTAHGTIERAVDAVRLGAFDFLEKPPHAEKILLTARNALRQAVLEEENRELLVRSGDGDDMIGDSPVMRELRERILRTAPTRARVLILGENGTGKELIARALHRHSPRHDASFVKVNCAAIPRDLFESELFGHERGAFTGATARRKGKFVRADGGTLFLDEVAEMPSALQAKLLRALGSGEVEPVGSDREIEVDVRLLAATNRDLARAVETGEFREDLYYRLQVVSIEAPPLRARKEDIPDLATHFLARACAEHNLSPRSITDDALRRLAAHEYPGNVRELRNWIERLVIFVPGAEIDAADVERCLSPDPRRRTADLPWSGTLRDTLADCERSLIRRALERCGWRMARTARELGLERSHLYKKIKSLGIERPD
jgi:DNA-binding NtrC family response regulator